MAHSMQSHFSPRLDVETERLAFLEINPPGFHYRASPPPHQLSSFLTPEDSLFQTIHMGPPIIDLAAYRLVVTGLVSKSCTLTLAELRAMPARTITSFHECYGSPIAPPTTRTNRIGNVTWTGVPLRTLLDLVGPLRSNAEYVWSDGLDSGTFAKVSADRYRKDITLAKALSDEVLVAYEMNGEPLERLRGGPARLVVPGWFGTNSTKWLCRLTVADRRAEGPFTEIFYNELVPGREHEGAKRPVWGVEVNSIIVRPRAEDVVEARNGATMVEGWAWSEVGVAEVGVSVDGGKTWLQAELKSRRAFEWQWFSAEVNVAEGSCRVLARAKDGSGAVQPFEGRRNHIYAVDFDVV